MGVADTELRRDLDRHHSLNDRLEAMGQPSWLPLWNPIPLIATLLQLLENLRANQKKSQTIGLSHPLHTRAAMLESILAAQPRVGVGGRKRTERSSSKGKLEHDRTKTEE